MNAQTQTIIIASTIGGFVAAVILTILTIDIIKVLIMVRWYHVPRADRTKVQSYKRRMEDAYTLKPDDHNPFAHVVTNEEFEANIREFEIEMDKKGAIGSIFGDINDSYCKLLRESIGVVIAPRAVLLQVAHPFVAIGIKQHSNVIRDTPKRFEKTYFHMFNMAFGTREQAIKSARTLRRIHNRVLGKSENAIGEKLPAGFPYNAAHTHAMLWVGLALAESVMFGYELLVGAFTDKERQDLARDASYGMMLMGVPRHVACGTADDFRVAIEACWESDIITVSEEARFIAHHLLYPTKWHLKPIFAVARYVTMVIMPPKLAVQFLGRQGNIFDHILVSIGGGLVRFAYRLVPGPLRYVPEYSQAVRRHGHTTAGCGMCDCCARGMESYMRWAKDFFIGMLLPSPTTTTTTTTQAHAVGTLTPFAGTSVSNGGGGEPPVDV